MNKNSFDFSSESFRSSSESREELSDGEFNIRCRSCSSVRLFFSKSGYYVEILEFSGRPEGNPESNKIPESAVDTTFDGLKIVPRSNENMARLVRYEGSLTSAAGGPVTAAMFRRDIGVNGARLELLDEPPSGEANYLPGYVQVQPALTAENTFAVVPDPSFRIPAPAILDFTEANGGIVLYQFTGDNPNDVYRTMRTASEEGYQSSLVLQTADRSGTYYFYCRVADYYGKGHVAVPGFRNYDGQEVVTTRIEIRINLDGSRNLETAN